MGKSFKMAWRNMWRNWRRTTIALVAIVLGLILLLFLDGMIKGSDQAIFGNAVRLYGGNVQVHAPGYRDKANRMPLLPLDDADAVVAAAEAQPEVVAAAKRINTGGLVSTRAGAFPVEITAIEPAGRGAAQHPGREHHERPLPARRRRRRHPHRPGPGRRAGRGGRRPRDADRAAASRKRCASAR